jgi:hypothetical protein
VSERCLNCEASYEGEYCPRCGQRSGGLDRPLGPFAREFAEEALGLDSRARLTVPALFLRPGEIAKEYVEGRRARFVPPIRLYLVTSFVMFLVLSQAGVEVENVTVTVGDTRVRADSAVVLPETEADTSAEDVLAERISRGFAQISEDPETFGQLFFNRMAQSMFFLLPAFALFLKAAYRKRPYLHHAVFAIYLHCFVFIVVTVTTVPEVIGLPALASMLDPLLLTVPIYLVLAMKRFYGEGWLPTLLKGWAVSITYAVLGGMTMTGLLLFSLLAM